jgi:predicted amidohydrolase
MFDDLCSRKGLRKMQMRVGLLQMADCGPRKEDLQAKGEAYCSQAAAMGAEIALLPELWYIGSHHFVDPRWSREYELWRGKHLWGKAKRHPDQEFEELIQLCWLLGISVLT